MNSYEVNTSIEGLTIQTLVTSYSLNLMEISNVNDPQPPQNEGRAARQRDPHKLYNQKSELDFSRPIILCNKCFYLTGMEESLTMGKGDRTVCESCVCELDDYHWVWSSKEITDRLHWTDEEIKKIQSKDIFTADEGINLKHIHFKRIIETEGWFTRFKKFLKNIFRSKANRLLDTIREEDFERAIKLTNMPNKQEVLDRIKQITR